MGIKVIKWDFTKRCNLRCLHCSVGNNYFSGDMKELSLDEKLQIVNNLATGGVNAITFLGGEPLMTMSDIFNVSKHAAALGIATSLVTNATLLNETKISPIIDAGISTVVISLDGATAKTHDTIRGNGTYQKVVANISKLVTHNKTNNSHLTIKVNTVLNKINYKEVDKLIDLCIALRVDELSILSLMKIGHTVDNVNKLMLTASEEIEASIVIAKKYSSIDPSKPLKITQQIAYPLVSDLIEQEHGLVMPKSNFCCSGSISLGFIAPDGNFYACDRILSQGYVGKKIDHAEIKPMNLLKHDFYEIWNSDYFIKMFNLILNKDTYSNYTPCNHCEYLISRKCNPCPLYSLDSEVSIKSCVIAERKIKKGNKSFNSNNTNLSYLIADSNASEEQNRSLSKEGRDIYDSIKSVIPVKNNGIRSINNGEDLILFSPYTNNYHILTLIGKYIWQLIGEDNTVSNIAVKVNEIVMAANAEVMVDIDKNELNDIINKKIACYFKILEQARFIKWSPINTSNDPTGAYVPSHVNQ